MINRKLDELCQLILDASACSPPKIDPALGLKVRLALSLLAREMSAEEARPAAARGKSATASNVVRMPVRARVVEGACAPVGELGPRGIPGLVLAGSSEDTP